MRIFFSYSHQDEAIRNKIDEHLGLLKREGLISSWHDRRLVAGADLDASIDREIERADLVLLLISSSFIDSGYCYGVELKTAMDRRSQGLCHVVPVIARPCDWRTAEFAKLVALPKDALPITKWPNDDDAYTNIAHEIRKLVDRSSAIAPAVAKLHKSPTIIGSRPIKRFDALRSSNLRIKKKFTDLDRRKFVDEVFEYVARFFEGSVSELHRREPSISGVFVGKGDAFTCEIFRDGESESACTVWIGDSAGKGIYYSNSISKSTSSFNECLSVDEDAQTMFLRSLHGSSRGNEERLSEEGAAEYLWQMLIERLQ